MGTNKPTALLMMEAEEELVMQDGWGLWVEEAGHVVKKFGSQKEIVSSTVELRGRYVDLD